MNEVTDIMRYTAVPTDEVGFRHDPAGEWVRFEDVAPELARLRPMAQSWESYEAAQDRKAALTSNLRNPCQFDPLAFGTIQAGFHRPTLGGSPVLTITDREAVGKPEVCLSIFEATALRDWLSGVFGAAETGCFDGYKDAFYQIAELLGLPAMPISPKQAFETVMLPKLRELVAEKAPVAPAATECAKHGVKLAFPGDECWACVEDAAT
jgi:hypothetical protein